MSDKILCFNETWTESAKRDGASVIAAFALVLPGVYLDSSPMQWLGFLMFVVVTLTRASGVRKKAARTPEEMIAEAEAMISARVAPTNSG